MEPDYVITGERVALGPLRVDLADSYRRWVHDPETRQNLLIVGMYTVEVEEEWVRDIAAKSSGLYPEAALFTIYDRSDGAPVGTCGLSEIDWRFARAEFGITLGERRGQGLGTEAVRLTLDWAFRMLGLHNVLLGVLPSNPAAIRSYEKAGFRRVGARRGAVVARGERVDEILMDAVPGG